MAGAVSHTHATRGTPVDVSAQGPHARGARPQGPRHTGAHRDTGHRARRGGRRAGRSHRAGYQYMREDCETHKHDTGRTHTPAGVLAAAAPHDEDHTRCGTPATLLRAVGSCRPSTARPTHARAREQGERWTG
jgi:hypothetical protein